MSHSLKNKDFIMVKNIKLIVGSTRNGRKARMVAEWLQKQAKDENYDLEIIDLRDMNLPLFDSAVSPAYMDVDTPEAKNWSKVITDSDGLVFLTAEHNRSIPASLKSAIDYLFKEWEGKPTAIVSYGFIDGGASATNHLKDILNWCKVNLVEPNVALPFTQDTFDSNSGEIADADKSFSEHREDFIKSLEAIENA